MDLEAMQESLARLSHELYGCLGRLEESQLEKELLVAERTQLIGQLQALTTALSWSVASSQGGGASGGGGEGGGGLQLEALNAYDIAAAERAEQRVAALRAALPAGSSVLVLCEQSELRPHIQVRVQCEPIKVIPNKGYPHPAVRLPEQILHDCSFIVHTTPHFCNMVLQGLHKQLQTVRSESSAESASLHQALDHAEGEVARCRAEGEAAEMARQEAADADAGLRARVVELEQKRQRQREEFEGTMRWAGRCLGNYAPEQWKRDKFGGPMLWSSGRGRSLIAL